MQAESPSCSLMIIILGGFINLLITNDGEHNCEGAQNLIGSTCLAPTWVSKFSIDLAII